MKKPKKHRFYLKNKGRKLSLNPSDSDRTGTTTNYKKSYHAGQRKKRLFGIDNEHKNKIISLRLNNGNGDSNNSSVSGCSNNIQPKKQHITTDDNSLNNSNRPSLSLRPTQSNPKPNSKYNRNSELMSLGIGGTFTDYNINDIIIENNNCIKYKTEIINTPNINIKNLFEWSCLEVCSWILNIDNNNDRYGNCIKSFIINNINGKALNNITFVNIVELTKYQIDVNDCTGLLNEIGLLEGKSNQKDNIIKKQVSDVQLKLGMIESSDDIDIPLFSTDNNSNEIVIEHGRFWRLFYFPKHKLLQYEVDKPVTKWTPYEVSLWINNIFDGKFSIYSHYFIQYQIDGQSLLNITRKCATNDLKMISPNIRRLFFDELRALSTLKQCNIRQMDKINHSQITRITHRFTQNDIIKFDPQISITSDGNHSIKSDDQIVTAKAQQIINDIHTKKNSTDALIVADLSYVIITNNLYIFIYFIHSKT